MQAVVQVSHHLVRGLMHEVIVDFGRFDSRRLIYLFDQLGYGIHGESDQGGTVHIQGAVPALTMARQMRVLRRPIAALCHQQRIGTTAIGSVAESR